MKKAEVSNFYCIYKNTVKPMTTAIFTFYSAISDVKNELVSPNKINFFRNWECQSIISLQNQVKIHQVNT